MYNFLFRADQSSSNNIDLLQDDSQFDIQSEPVTKVLSEDPIPDSQFNIQTEPSPDMDSLQFNGHSTEVNGHAEVDGHVQSHKVRRDVESDSGEEGDADDTRDELSPQLGRRRSRRKRNMENGHTETSNVNGEVNGELDRNGHVEVNETNETNGEPKSLLTGDDDKLDTVETESKVEPAGDASVERRVTIKDDNVFDDSSKKSEKSSRRISAATSSDDDEEQKKTRTGSRNRTGSQGKRASFSKKGKAETIATSTVSEDKRSAFAKSRSTSSSDANPPRNR